MAILEAHHISKNYTVGDRRITVLDDVSLSVDRGEFVVIEGDSVEQVVLRGPGAGEGPTASAVMGDVMDIARGLKLPVFGQPAETLKLATSSQASVPHRFYIRLSLKDRD